MGLEILRFSQNDKLNDTLSISAVVVLGARKLCSECFLVSDIWLLITAYLPKWGSYLSLIP